MRQSKTKSIQPFSRRAITVMGLCAAFLFYKYILQNFPSVMANQLMTSFHLQGLGLGVLSGVYFWTYLIVPLFVGIILDHYGTRWVTSFAILVCAIGIAIFSQAEHLNTAIAGRALTGVGVSFATIAYFKLAAVWFDKKYYALLASFVVAAAMVGAVCGQMPLAWLMQQVGWRQSLMDLTYLGIVLAVLFLIYVRDEPTDAHQHASQPLTDNDRSIWQNILLIVKSKQNWLLTGYGGLAFSPVVIFCGLWGNPFIQQAYHLDKLTSSTLISLVFVGLGIGSPILAAATRWVKNRCTLMGYSTLISALALTLVIYVHPMSIWLLGSLLFIFGFFLGSFSIVFVIGKESNPLYLAGTVISLINASDAFLDAITEPLIGAILDIFGKTAHAHGFSLFSYHLALGLLPLYQILGALLLKWVKDEHNGL
jgi:MFS family permease